MENLVATIRKEKGTSRANLEYDAVSVTISTFVNSYFYVKHKDDATGLMLMISNVGQEFPIANVTMQEWNHCSRYPLPTPRKVGSFGSHFYWFYIATMRIMDDPESLYGMEWPVFFPKAKDDDFSILDLISKQKGEIDSILNLLKNPQDQLEKLVKDEAQKVAMRELTKYLSEPQMNMFKKMKVINKFRSANAIKAEALNKASSTAYSKFVKTKSTKKKAKKVAKTAKLAKKIGKYFIL